MKYSPILKEDKMLKFFKNNKEKSFKTITESLNVMMQDLCTYADEQSVAIKDNNFMIEELNSNTKVRREEKEKALRTANKLGEILI